MNQSKHNSSSNHPSWVRAFVATFTHVDNGTNDFLPKVQSTIHQDLPFCVSNQKLPWFGLHDHSCKMKGLYSVSLFCKAALSHCSCHLECMKRHISVLPAVIVTIRHTTSVPTTPLALLFVDLGIHIL